MRIYAHRGTMNKGIVTEQLVSVDASKFSHVILVEKTQINPKKQGAHIVYEEGPRSYLAKIPGEPYVYRISNTLNMKLFEDYWDCDIPSFPSGGL